MKKLTQTFIHYFLFVTFMVAVLVIGCSCSTSKSEINPLAGWQKVYTQEPSQTIVRDFQDFIQSLPANERNSVGPTFYFQDATGQHAVDVQVSLKGKNAAWHYAFIYDKNDKRIKVIKYGYIEYQS